ncbi:hypothetical protein DL762_004902 [Monosporascus cannonballus]|uniref:Protein kinase domain-containing protein n=1 Tax=Monosporascus cannonballus TaxID=155416 RepID=A0ABY0H6U1_9PEZI|nr:hypothetical protein DL762_004902 [Monosporascus cannonballus]
MLMNIHSDNIITYHGSFRQNGTYNLILDYADGGSLGDLLGKQVPPSAAEDIEQFWRSLFGVLNGLQSIHQWMEPGDDSPIRGIHEDIKPDNILLFKGRSGSAYDFTPKVADFGLFSHVRQSKASSSEATGLDNHGNQRFSSPECSHNTARMSKGPNWITSKADIFSLGALFSDCAAWIAGGRELQAKYLKKRLSYHTTNNTFQGNGYDGCFHDGIDPLPIIDDFHKEIRRLCQPHDSITPGVVDIVQSHMLLRKPVDRLNPQKLSVKFVQLLPSSKLVLTGPIPIHWESTLPSSAVASAALPPQGAADADPADADIDDVDMASSETAGDGVNRTCPQLRITPCEVDLELPVGSGQFKDSGCGSSQASNIQESHENGTKKVRRTSKSSSALDSRNISLTLEELGQYRTAIKSRQDPDPEAQEVVEFILHNLAGRDQFFFIDDSTSMKDYTLVVNKTFLSLSWLTKRLDPDKLELSFASAPAEIFKAKKTKKLSKRVSEQQYHRDPTLMEWSFGHLVDDVLIPRLPCKFFGLNFNPFARRQMSVYIFTDGNWGDEPGVARPLRRLMKKMQERDLDRSQVSLHFIRFGSLTNGQNNLHFLDELGRGEKWDIVDVKDVSHPVTDILMGPMSPDVDNKVYDS